MRGTGTSLVWRIAQIASVTLVVALLGFLVYDITHDNAGQIANTVDSGHNTPAYDFTAQLVGSSRTLSLKSLRGKVVVLNFWQSYCPPCTNEARTVSMVSKRWAGKGVEFVGIDVQDLPGPALKFMHRFDITYPVVSDDGSLVGRYGVTGYPETFFIDRAGMVVSMPPTDCPGNYCQIGHIIGGATTQTLDAGITAAMRA